MNNIWSILGISPTGDRRAINRAYALKLREHRPEDDPEGFSRLVEARAEALDIAGPASIADRPDTEEVPGPNRAYSNDTGPDNSRPRDADPAVPGTRYSHDPMPVETRISPAEPGPSRDDLLRRVNTILFRAPASWSQVEWDRILQEIDQFSIGEQGYFLSRLATALPELLPETDEAGLAPHTRTTILWLVGQLDERYGIDTASVRQQTGTAPALRWGDWSRLRQEIVAHDNDPSALSRADWEAVLPLAYHIHGHDPLACREGYGVHEVPRHTRLLSRAKLWFASFAFPNLMLAQGEIALWRRPLTIACMVLLTLPFLVSRLADIGLAEGWFRTRFPVYLAGQALGVALFIALHGFGASRFARLLTRSARERVKQANRLGMIGLTPRREALSLKPRKRVLAVSAVADLASWAALAGLFLLVDRDIGPWRFVAPTPKDFSVSDYTPRFARMSANGSEVWLGYTVRFAQSDLTSVGVFGCLRAAGVNWACKDLYREVGASIDWLSTPQEQPRFLVTTRPQGHRQQTQTYIVFPDPSATKQLSYGGWRHADPMKLCGMMEWSCHYASGSGQTTVLAVRHVTEAGNSYAILDVPVELRPRDPVNLLFRESVVEITHWLDVATQQDALLFVAEKTKAGESDEKPALFSQAVNEDPVRIASFPLRPMGPVKAFWAGQRLYLYGEFVGQEGEIIRGYVVENNIIRDVTERDGMVLLRKGNTLVDGSMVVGRALSFSMDGGGHWQETILPEALEQASLIAHNGIVFAFTRKAAYQVDLRNLSERR